MEEEYDADDSDSPNWHELASDEEDYLSGDSEITVIQLERINTVELSDFVNKFKSCISRITGTSCFRRFGSFSSP